MKYLNNADHVIFSTPYEQYAVGIDLPEIYKKSNIVPIFSTIPIQRTDPNLPRSNSIVNFGSIRSRRGLQHVIQLARLIRDDKELKYMEQGQDVKVIIAGSPNNSIEIWELIKQLYHLSSEEVPKKYTQEDRIAHIQTAYAKLDELKAKGRQPIYPVELVLDASPEELMALFQNSSFAYMPIEGGASQRSCSLSAVMGNGCITITKLGDHTP